MIDEMLKRFERKAIAPVVIAPVVIAPVVNTPVAPQASVVRCGKCGGLDHWQAFNNQQWFCLTCRPPFTPSMVARLDGPCARVDQDIATTRPAVVISSPQPSVICRFHYTMAHKACEQCNGRLYTETTWDDGRCQVICWVCRHELSGPLWYDDPQEGSKSG